MMIRNFLLTFTLFIFSFTLYSQTFDWLQLVYNGSNDYVIDIHVDEEGFIYTTGRSKGAADFGMIGGASESPFFFGGNHDAYAAKYNPEGELLWARIVGGLVSDWGYGVTTDSEGGVYVTGVFLSLIHI